MTRKVFIAAAWPYANGSLHLGHVAALLGSDIIARYYRQTGAEVLFVSGSDCHGTPIAVEADKQNVHPSKIAQKYHEEFVRMLIDGVGFSYDTYTTTTTDNHREVVQDIFLKLFKDGHIYTKSEELPYCPKCKRFLPDRYIEGECPHCHFGQARGDQCDNCGKLLDPRDLINPHCKICGTVPEWRQSEHFFLRLSAFEKQLKKWISASTGWRSNAKQFALNLIEQGLQDRAITRDTEWGIEIPLPGYETKRIYVWFEAVSGYLSASKEWATTNGESAAWEPFWKEKKTLHYYVHGKDNIPFHTIIWPTMLLAYGGLHLPDRIISSEYLTLEGQQFSKSRHWAVWLPDFLKQFESDTLRYYLVAAGPEGADANFSWSDFRTRINAELIGTFGNFVNRVVSFVAKNFPDGVDLRAPDAQSATFLRNAEAAFSQAGKSIEEARFREGLRIIFQLAEEGNRFINDAAPWSALKTDRAKAERDLAVALHVIRCLAILIAPYLPKAAEKINAQLGLTGAQQWIYQKPALLRVGSVNPLFRLIEEDEVAAQIEKLGK